MEDVHLKIGVNVEPTEEFSRVAYALGFVRVVACRDCVFAGTQHCPMNDDARKCSAFCSFGRMKNDGTD